MNDDSSSARRPNRPSRVLLAALCGVAAVLWLLLALAVGEPWMHVVTVAFAATALWQGALAVSDRGPGSSPD